MSDCSTRLWTVQGQGLCHIRMCSFNAWPLGSPKCLSFQLAHYTQSQGNYQLLLHYAHFGLVEAGEDRSYECSRVRLHPRSDVALDK